MKYSIRPTPEPRKQEPPEKEVEFWLEDRCGMIILKGAVKGATFPNCPNILTIYKNSGESALNQSVNKDLGLKLDEQERINCYK